MLAKSILEPWKSFFTEIDNSLHEELTLQCLGGFVMTMLYGLVRPTADVDVLPLGVNSSTESLMRLAGEGSALHKKCGVYLQIVGVAQIPLNYEDRLTEMFARTFNHLRLLLSTHTTSHFQRSNEIHNVTEMTVKHLARTPPLDLDVLKN